jgi:hypothetical protein
VNDVNNDAAYAPRMDQLKIEGEIAKVDDEQRQVFGWASVTEINGEPVVDLQNDYLETIELEKAAYDYVLHSRVGGEMHDRVKKVADSPKQVGTLIESMVFTPEKIEKMGLPPSTPRGWWIGFQVGRDDLGSAAWEQVKKGKYTGFSIHGLGRRIEKSMDEIGKSVLDRSEQEILGWLQRVSEQIGADPAEVAAALDELLEGEGDVGDDDIHDLLMERFGSGQMLAKHLLGRHEQKDHDPTNGGGHRRSDHKQMRHDTRDHGKQAEAKAWEQLTSEVGESEAAHLNAKTMQRFDELYYNALPYDHPDRKRKVGKSMTTGEFLIAKAAQRASSHEEFAANIGEISKALEGFEPEAAAYFDAIHKHLIGRHEQQDHDPTKKGKGAGHKRSEHGGKWGSEGVKQGTKIGAGLGAGLGAATALAMRRAGLPSSVLGRAALTSGAGSLSGYQIGGGQMFGNRPDAGGARRFGAGAMNTWLNAPATAARRLIHGDPNAYYAQQRHGKRQRKLAKRQLEVLEKYLGPISEDDQ